LNIRPLHDRVLVRRIEETETIRGGIIIPDSAKEKPQQGEVGGVRILFGKYSGSEVKIAGEEYLVVREDEILGVLAK